MSLIQPFKNCDKLLPREGKMCEEEEGERRRRRRKRKKKTMRKNETYGF